MEQHNRKTAIMKLIVSIVFIVTITLAGIAAYLLYKGSFNSIAFSNWMFYAAIVYAVLAVIPLYDVITTSNSASYIYGEYAVKGRIENKSRVDEALTKKSHRFSILMIITSILLFIGCFAAERFF